MARRKCYYMLIIVCPYLFMILLFYHEVQESEREKTRLIDIQDFMPLYHQTPVKRTSDRLNHKQSTRASVLVDKHVNRNPKSNFKKPEMAKLSVKVKRRVKKKIPQPEAKKIPHIKLSDPNVVKIPKLAKNTFQNINDAKNIDPNLTKFNLNLDSNRVQMSNQNLSIKNLDTNMAALSNQNSDVKRENVNGDENILLGGKSTTTTTTVRHQVPKPVLNKKTCIDMKIPADQTNYGFHNLSSFHIFSVFYDNRQEKAIIRLIVLKQQSNNLPLLCGFGKKGHLYIVPGEPYGMCENHSKEWGGWIISCEVPSHFKNTPCQVYLSLSVDGFRKKHRSTVLKLNITMETKSTVKKKDFGICVPPIFDDISILSLVQFVELSKLLGAIGITFYQTFTSPTEVNKILEYYQNKGEITVVPWQLPSNMTEKNLWYFGQILAVQDCLYRNMARFQYLAFNDLDEFIVPQNLTNWKDMVAAILKNASVSVRNLSGLSFKSAFFSPNQPADGTYKVRFLQFLKRTKTFSSIRSKLIVKPENIFELGIHHVSRPMRKGVTVEVEPSLAYLHHYRECNADYDQNMKCQPLIEDFSLLRYGKELQKNYLQVMDEVVSLVYGVR